MTKPPHDEQRSERPLERTNEALEPSPEAVKDQLRNSPGYVPGATVAIFDPDGQILLMQRADNAAWCLPGGFVEPGETPAEAAVREAHEETGLKIQLTSLVCTNIISPNEYGNPNKHVHFVYRGEKTDGMLAVSDEGKALEYRRPGEVQDWHPYHDTYASKAQTDWVER